MTCPNEQHPDFKVLVNNVGLNLAYDIYYNLGTTPTVGVAPNGNPSIQYQKLTSDDKVKQWIASKTTAYQSKFNASLDLNGEREIILNDDFNDFVSNLAGEEMKSAYITSSSEAINNAINSADVFIKKMLQNSIDMARAYTSPDMQNLESELLTLEIQKDIELNDLGNLAQALTHVLNYFNKTMYIEPGLHRAGGILYRLNQYENADMNLILNNPKETHKLDLFLKHALTFIGNYVNVNDLNYPSSNNEVIEEGEQAVINIIKQLQSFTADVSNAKNKLDKLIQKRNEVDLLKYTSNPEILDGLRNMFDVGDDENLAQYMLDALHDTNNPFVANLITKYSVNVTDGKREYEAKIEHFHQLLKNEFGKDVSSLTAEDFNKFLEHVDNNRTGRLAQKFDWEAFNKAKKEYFDSINHLKKKNFKQYQAEAIKWYEKNEIQLMSQEEIINVVNEKRETLSRGEFNKWSRTHLKVINGKYYTRLTADTLFRQPTDNYISKDWDTLKNNEVYNFLLTTLNDITNSFGKETILDKGYIPSDHIDNENKSWLESAEAWVDSKKAKQKNPSFAGANDQIIRVLTIPMANFYSIEEPIQYRRQKPNEDFKDYQEAVLADIKAAGKGEFKDIKEVKEENDRIKKANEEAHSNSINYNLAEVFQKFIKEGTIYKYKANMKNQFDIALYQIGNMQFADRDNKGKLIVRKAASKVLNNKIIKFSFGEGTNLQKHYEEWLEAIFYDNFDIDEGAFTQIAKILQNYVSAKNMWFNVTAGINNIALGRAIVRTEAIGSYYFDTKTLMDADKMYMASMWDFIANTGKEKESLVGKVIDYFDVNFNTTEKDYAVQELKKQLFSSNALYVMNNIGEHFIQNTPLVAMMNSHRVVDGRIMTLADFKYYNIKKALDAILDDSHKLQLDAFYKANIENEEHKESKKDYYADYVRSLPKDLQNEFIKTRKELDKQSEEDFAKYDKLIDHFSIEDGKLVIKDGETLKLQINKFKNRVLGVNQLNNGIYNKDDINMFQRRAVGKLVTQFRKFMRPGWNKRFGSKLWKSYWNERRQAWDVPMYKSFVNLLGAIYSGGDRFTGEEYNKYTKFMLRLLPDIKNFGTNARIYWNTLDEYDKANVRKTVTELSYLALTVIIAGAVSGIKFGDDKDKRPYLVDLLLYQNDALFSNLIFYTPFGLVNEGRKMLDSPAAVGSSVSDIYKFLKNGVLYPIRSDEDNTYQTGIYDKESKLKVSAMKLVPILNKYQSMKRIDKFNKYYMLFRG